MTSSDYQSKKLKYDFVRNKIIELGFTKITRNQKIETFFLPDANLGFDFGVQFRLYRKWSCDGFELGFVFNDFPVTKLGILSYYSFSLLAVNITLGLHKDPVYFSDISNRQEKEFDWEFWLKNCIIEVRQLTPNLPLEFESDQIFGYSVSKWLMRPLAITPP